MSNFYSDYQKLLSDAKLAIVYYVTEHGFTHPFGDGKFLWIPEQIKDLVELNVRLINEVGTFMDGTGYSEQLENETNVLYLADKVNLFVPKYMVKAELKDDVYLNFFFNFHEVLDVINARELDCCKSLEITQWNKVTKQWEAVNYSYILVNGFGDFEEIIANSEAEFVKLFNDAHIYSKTLNSLNEVLTFFFNAQLEFDFIIEVE